MDAGRDEGVAQGVHPQQGRRLRRIAEVVGVLAAGEGRTGLRLGGDEAGALAIYEAVTHEGEAKAGVVGAAAHAADDDVRVVARHLHLLHRLLADDGLVEEDVVEDGAQGVVGVVLGGGVLRRLRDGDAEGARRIRVLLQDGPPRLGIAGGRGDDLGAPGLHHDAPIGLLMVGDLHHVDLELNIEQVAGHSQGAAPLAGAGLRGQPLDAGLLVVVGLSDGGVGLVRAGGGDAFVLVVDVGGGVQRLLQPVGPEQGRGPPELVDLPHLVRDVSEAFRAHLLLDEGHGEEGRQRLGADGLVGGGVEGRGQRTAGGGQVRQDVVPLPGYVLFV